MRWYKSSLGKKYFMAITGLMMIGFVIAHMFGNFSIFAGADGINAYAEHLRAFPPLLYVFRLVMVAAFLLHIWFGLNLYLENRAARPVDYAKKVNDRTSFSAQTMIWTGLILGAFVVYHLLHFTTHAFNPEYAEMVEAATGRFDVFTMVVTAFNKPVIALLYVVAMIILLLHLAHGMQSFFQSLGLTNDNTLPPIEKGSRVVAFFVMLGFLLIPLTILFGMIKL